MKARPKPSVNGEAPVHVFNSASTCGGAVVDDESPVRTMLRRLLRLADYKVATFASGEEFLNPLTARVPLCMILDVHMPGLSGFDVKSRMRAANIEVPIVFITASDDVSLDRFALEAGGICLLRKPFSSDQLLEAVGMALRKIRFLHELH